jgi:multicomponent Na+:H+ antiporter subunit E
MSPSAPSPHRRSVVLRALGFVLFIVQFLRALVLANVQLARAVLFQRCEDLAPGFLTYPVDGLSKFEILVLSHAITLTPGTTTVEISADFKQLVVHAFDARDVEATVRDIQRDLEAPILRWTR